MFRTREGDSYFSGLEEDFIPEDFKLDPIAEAYKNISKKKIPMVEISPDGFSNTEPKKESNVFDDYLNDVLK
jgi:hypothetical protein